MMHTKSLPLALASLLLLAGCATSTEEKHAIPAEGVAVVAPDATPPTGSHIRSKKKDTLLGATNKMSGEDFKRESNANRTDPTGDQIVQARNEGR